MKFCGEEEDNENRFVFFFGDLKRERGVEFIFRLGILGLCE